jgi:hypothetical protein
LLEIEELQPRDIQPNDLPANRPQRQRPVATGTWPRFTNRVKLRRYTSGTALEVVPMSGTESERPRLEDDDIRSSWTGSGSGSNPSRSAGGSASGDTGDPVDSDSTDTGDTDTGDTTDTPDSTYR